MNYFLSSMILLSVSAVFIALTSRFKKLSEKIFLVSLVIGCALGLISAVGVLINRTPLDCRLNFRMPAGEFHIGIDLLSAFFLLTIIVLFFAAGVYGYGYLKGHSKENLSVHYALYHLALISLMLVVTAQNAVLFLIAWEIVTLSSYFLIIFYDK